MTHCRFELMLHLHGEVCLPLHQCRRDYFLHILGQCSFCSWVNYMHQRFNLSRFFLILEALSLFLTQFAKHEVSVIRPTRFSMSIPVRIKDLIDYYSNHLSVLHWGISVEFHLLQNHFPWYACVIGSCNTKKWWVRKIEILERRPSKLAMCQKI